MIITVITKLKYWEGNLVERVKPSSLCTMLEICTSEDMNGHIQTSHIPEGDELYFFVATVSRTRNKDKRELKVYYVQTLPTNHMQQQN